MLLAITWHFCMEEVWEENSLVSELKSRLTSITIFTCIVQAVTYRRDIETVRDTLDSFTSKIIKFCTGENIVSCSCCTNGSQNGCVCYRQTEGNFDRNWSTLIVRNVHSALLL